MAISEILQEKEFLKPRDGHDYRVKARAIFLVLQYPEAGQWHVAFDVEASQPVFYAPDKRLLSKAAAQKAAGHAFASGEVERFIGANLQTWIVIGAIQPARS